ncbi:type 2 lanthipeptide synthetase LanM [Chryseobacterium profundimaris]|uniref:Type 2 lantibiotic biosynthesis protein LanM n=1 Tax=Chryseobacterium profundimaris TaxID=1387275 RepID=A0ABY1P5R5_9FLAO|nr:type 2 lanthipeptide synthetase LanM [Chryseobacterium profundimaris]SMP25634.1 type 2 lantibiotic biosynthesis protein LanM [Chryseobacterium profundimaris]
MENETLQITETALDKIPFVDIFPSYTESFLSEVKKMNVSITLMDKFHVTLLQQLSSIAEVTLQEELDFFKKNQSGDYEQFVGNTRLILEEKYPVLDLILKRTTTNYLLHIRNIFSNFSKDFNCIAETFSLNTHKNITIEDIDADLGDGHSGESTALVTLSGGTKLIYKPRNIEITNAYNRFISWLNSKLNTDLKTLKYIAFEHYGWLEFAAYEPVHSSGELKEYYYKAGILLAAAFLLGSKDCHYENIIACGRNPIIIDHETIVQPVLSDLSLRTWDEQHKAPLFSVLESMLIVNKDTGSPVEYAGFGNNGSLEVMNLEKQIISPNSIDCKRDTRFIFRKLIKNNVPVYYDNPVFANDYKNYFIKGFSAAYDTFIMYREELNSLYSPLKSFENKKIRYVWRPTFVYFRILQYMRGASFMKSFETYSSKLYALMSKAYQKEGTENYHFILDHEMKQMLNGDIPFFMLNSLDCHLEENSFRIFKYNSLENIQQRLKLLSTDHKNQQIEYISKWLQ